MARLLAAIRRRIVRLVEHPVAHGQAAENLPDGYSQD